MREEETPVDPTEIDWHEVARKALGSAMVAALVGGAMQALSDIVRAEMRGAHRRRRPIVPVESNGSPPHDEIDEAAQLLGVSRDASEDQVRAALRAHLVDERLHPDQGGDGAKAARLIAAKNLLVEEIRARQP